jgi:hypothetical protein
MAKSDKVLTPQQTIVNAWRTGKKQVVVDDRLFSLTLQVHHPIVHKKDGTHVKVKEQWIIAVPADGSRLPLYSVGYNNKLRSSV